MKRWLLTTVLFSAIAQAETVVCHLTYGGETRTVAAGPVASPYTVPVVQVGSYFLFKLVFEQDRQYAAIKTYVYADRDAGPQPLHQATYAYPPVKQGRFGFTGLHFVYEPVRDGELEYWCDIS
jgi:hypothetical protein